MTISTQFSEKRSTLLSYQKLLEKKTRQHPSGMRLRRMFDQGEYEELMADRRTSDPLDFPGYREKLREAEKITGAPDALTAAYGTVFGIPVYAAELNKHFMMGSMGTVVGEKIAALAELAQKNHRPLVIFSVSGGARMQEGMLSLYQMAKTSAAIQRFKDAGGLFISVLTNPTTGGVSASFASLGDIILAEPGALIGFAGPRVIEQTIHEKLPEGFQRAEFQLEHGFVDRIVEPENMRDTIGQLLRLHGFAEE